MYVPVRYNTITDLYTILLDRGRTDAEVAATLVAGDVQLSKDGGTFTNLTALPTVSPVGGVQIKISLTAVEAQCKIGMIRFKDQVTPPKWEEQVVVFYTYGHASAYDTRDFTTQQDLVNRVWDETLTNANHNITDSTGQRLRRTYESKVVSYGTAQNGGINTITLAGSESSINDIYSSAFITIVAGTGAGQTRSIRSYNGTTKIVTVAVNWVTNPDATSVYLIQTMGTTRVSDILTAAITNTSFAANAIDSSALATSAVDEIVDQVWDELRSEHTVVGSFGQGIASVQGDVTGKVLGTGASVISGTGVRSILEDNAISAAKIATDAITADKIAANAIGASEIADNAITSSKIAANAITSSQIAANAIGNSQIANNAISSTKIAIDAIGADQIATSAVEEISSASATSVWDRSRASHTVAGSFGQGVASVQGDLTGKVLGGGASVITGTGVQASLQDNAITAAKIASAAITNAKFAANAIDSSALATSAVDEIVDQVWDELRSEHTVAGSFGQGVASVQGDLTGKVLGGGASVITGTGVQASLQDNAITAAKFANDSITANAIAANAITSAKIADNSITSAKIAANAIGSSQIANAAITSSKFATDAIDANTLATSAVSEIISALLVNPANKILTDVSGRVTLIPAESIMLTYGQAQTGSLNTLRLAAGFPTTTDIYKGAVIRIYSGTGAGQVRTITGYNGTNGDVSVDRTWTTNPDSTSLYSIVSNDVLLTSGNFNPSSITSSAIAANAIGSTQIANAAITSSKFATDAIDANALATSAATEIAAAILVNSSNKLLTDSSGHIIVSDNSITSAKIAANAITSSQIAASAITSDKIAANAIGNSQIANAAISSTKFAVNAIDASSFASSTVDKIVASILVNPANKLLTDSNGKITSIPAESMILATGQAQSGGTNILQLAIGFPTVHDIYKGALLKLYAGTGAGQIRSITSYNGITGNVTVDRQWVTVPNSTTFYSIVAADNIISAGDFTPGAIDSNAIAAGAIGNSQIADGAISDTKIASAAITSSKYAANAVNANAIASDAVTKIAGGVLLNTSNRLLTDASGHITPADNSISVNKIAANAITAAKIATDAIGAAQLATDGVNEIAAATTNFVWDKPRSSHLIAGSFGEGVKIESLNTQAKADVKFEADKAIIDYDVPNRTDLNQTESDLTSEIVTVSNKIGTPISIDSGVATISGMLTKIVDDNDGADFDSTYNSLATLVTAGVNIEAIAKAVWDVEASDHNDPDTFGKQVNDSRTLIGTPVSLDGGSATLGGMLTKIADDNDGLNFSSKTDSLNKIRSSIVPAESVSISQTLNSGNIVVGSHTMTHVRDANYFRLTPSGSNKLDIEFSFEPGLETVPVKVTVFGRYQVPAPIDGKFIDVFAYNYNLASFQKISSVDNRIYPSVLDILYSFYLNIEHINPASPNNVRIKFISNDKNIASNLYLDYIGLFYTTDISSTLNPSDLAKSNWTYSLTPALSTGALMRFSSVIFSGTLTQVTDAKTFKVAIGPTGGTAWNEHVLVHQDLISGEQQCAPVLSADSSGNIILRRNLSIIPKVGDSIAILKESHVNSISSALQDSISDGVWDELRSGHTIVGSFGEGISSVRGNVIGNVTGNVQGSIGSLAAQAQTDVKSRVDQSLVDYQGATKTDLNTAVSTIRGGTDTLKTISDKVDNVTTTINGISNVTRITTSLPTYMTRPAAGSKAIRVEVALKDQNGIMEDPDSNQLAIQVFDSAGISYNIQLYKNAAFSAPLDLGTGIFTQYRKLERLTTGIYVFFFRIDASTDETELIFKFGWIENTLALYEYRGSQIVDAANDITAILSSVNTIKSQTDKLRFDANNRVEADAEAIASSTLAATRVSANISNLNATITSRSTLTSSDVSTAAASAILQTPANKLKTDISGRIEVAGTKNTLDTLKDISVADILNGTVDVKTVRQTLEVLLAYAQGRVVKSGSNYSYYKQDNSTSLFTLTATPSQRTRS